MKPRTVWVIEMWNDIRNQWEPTVGIGLCREDGRTDLAQWKIDNPDDKFRLATYHRVGPKGGGA